MAAMRQADSDNIVRLRVAFPEVYDELHKRYGAPGGILPTDKGELERNLDEKIESLTDYLTNNFSMIGGKIFHPDTGTFHDPKDCCILCGQLKHEGECRK
jgi:hypothetical protein